ncbi:MAG: RecQ family zinc-binding domain-containing protein, partial [Gemmatimonadales bacterium]
RCILLFRRRDSRFHRRQVAVTFPPRRLLERIWSGEIPQAKVPRGVREAAARLRREVPPGAGGEGWNRIERRRREALARIRAVMRYASSRRCRRRVLLGWFGESAARCGNCDRCGLHSG